MSATLGFLGFGNMAEAIFRGLLSAGTYSVRNLCVFDVDPAKRAKASEAGAKAVPDAANLARESDVILLATKPQDMAAALAELKPGFRESSLVVSVAAGISTKFIQDRLGPGARIVRVMPNTPAFVSAGAAGFALSPNATDNDAKTVQRIFDAVGITERVDESQMDLITALVGSGPADFFFIVEAMTQAAVAAGLPESQAAPLAAQVCYGAGKLLHDSGESAATLRERVTSKGGTTFAALETFRALNLADVIARGMDAAAKRSKELGS